MTGHREALTSYKKKKFTTQVELGDDSTYKLEGVGSTSLQLDSGMVLHIDDVLYVPGLNKNLLFVAGLEDKGYKVLFVITYIVAGLPYSIFLIQYIFQPAPLHMRC